MIQANELMIGNLLLFKFTNREDEVLPVTEIHKGFLVLGTQVAAMKYIEPIPLTEEWLLKFGFQRIAYHENRFAFTDNEYFEIDTDGSIYFERDYTAVDLKYVHQLQNLYFALTQTHLKTS